jgi:hypothetical protein
MVGGMIAHAITQVASLHAYSILASSVRISDVFLEMLGTAQSAQFLGYSTI